MRWKAKIKIDLGLTETVKWYFQNRLFLKKISKKNYDKRLGLKI